MKGGRREEGNKKLEVEDRGMENGKTKVEWKWERGKRGTVKSKEVHKLANVVNISKTQELFSIYSWHRETILSEHR